MTARNLFTVVAASIAAPFAAAAIAAPAFSAPTDDTPAPHANCGHSMNCEATEGFKAPVTQALDQVTDVLSMIPKVVDISTLRVIDFDNKTDSGTFAINTRDGGSIGIPVKCTPYADPQNPAQKPINCTFSAVKLQSI